MQLLNQPLSSEIRRNKYRHTLSQNILSARFGVDTAEHHHHHREKPDYEDNGNRFSRFRKSFLKPAASRSHQFPDVDTVFYLSPPPVSIGFRMWIRYSIDSNQINQIRPFW